MVDRIVLISGDSDFVPAAKLARREGIDFILDPLYNHIPADLSEHIDGLRTCDNQYKQDQVAQENKSACSVFLELFSIFPCFDIAELAYKPILLILPVKTFTVLLQRRRHRYSCGTRPPLPCLFYLENFRPYTARSSSGVNSSRERRRG